MKKAYLGFCMLFIISLLTCIVHAEASFNHLNYDDITNVDITNFCGVYHNLTVGNSQHNPLEFLKTVNGTKRNLSIELNNLSSIYGDNVTVAVKLIDKTTSKPVVNKTVFLESDDLPQGVGKTNSLGIAKIRYVPDFANLKPDIYQFKLSSPEDSQYEYNESDLTVNVNRVNATVLVRDVKCDQGSKCNITAVFKNNTQPVSTPVYGQLVDFYCNGVKIGSDVTSFNGIAKCTFTPKEKGNFTILVRSAAGNEYYNPSNTTANLVVDKYRAVLQMISVRGKPGDKVYLTAYLTDAVTGKVIPNMKIHFDGIIHEYLGFNYTTVRGYARFVYVVPNVQNGTYNISSVFEGNDDYKFVGVHQIFLVDKGILTEGYPIF